MPRDDSMTGDPAAGTDDLLDPGSSGQRAALKRGDACLYCRKRRIRCTAEKPTCAHCRKLKRECVYDTGKPVSRVKQLEEKVAELEEMLKTTGGPQDSDSTPPQVARSSTSTSSQRQDSATSFDGLAYGLPGQNPFNQTQNYTVPPPAPLDPLATFNAQNQYSVNLNDLPSTSAQTSAFGTTGPINQGFQQPAANYNNPSWPSGVSQQAVEQFDFSMLDPSFVSLLSSMNASANPFHATDPAPQPPVPNGYVDQPGSTGLTPFLEPDPPSIPPPMPKTEPRRSNTVSPHSVPIQPPIGGSSSVSYSAYVTDVAGPSPKTVDGGYSLGFGGGPREDEPMPDQALTGGWFDPADLPKVARDHLLDLFFGKMKFFGQEFHIPRFFASLTLPPAKRPHQCLLYAMYLLACRVSTSPSIRVLETHFASIALRQLDEALARSDRLFDVIRACTLMAVYHFGAAHYHEGWMMTGRAARLAISCGLHAIPSSQFQTKWLETESKNELSALVRKRLWAIPPPSDPIELGERIWGFWTIYVVDRCGAISTMWPCAIPDEIVSTPFPRPLYEYELGLVSRADDRTMSSVWAPTPPPPLPPYADATYASVRMRSLGILDRASKLIHLDPEEGWEQRLRETASSTPPSDPPSNSPPGWGDDWLSSEQYQAIFGDWTTSGAANPPGLTPAPKNDAGSAAGIASGKGWMRCARIRTPKAYEEVKRALDSLEGDLTPDFKTDWSKFDAITPQWHYNSANSVSRDLFSLHFAIGCSWMFLFDVTSFNAPNDLAIGCARRMVLSIAKVIQYFHGSEMDVFTIMTWSFISKTLIREVKRLHAMGDKARAAPIEADVETIVSGFKMFGPKLNIATSQAEATERYRSSTDVDTQFLEDDDVDELEGTLPQRNKEMHLSGMTSGA